jgi:hypothetical protein
LLKQPIKKPVVAQKPVEAPAPKKVEPAPVAPKPIAAPVKKIELPTIPQPIVAPAKPAEEPVVEAPIVAPVAPVVLAPPAPVTPIVKETAPSTE